MSSTTSTPCLPATAVLGLEPFVDLQEGDDTPPFPQESRNRIFLRLPVHRAFEKDGRDDLGSGEGRRGHDAHAHLMHEPEHLYLATIGAVRNAIEAQRVGCRSAALVKRGDETILAGDLRRHLVIGHDRHPRFETGTLRTARPASTDCPQAGERFLSIHAAQTGGVGVQIVRDWVVRINAKGFDGLLNGKAPGARSILDDSQGQALRRIVEDGPIPAVHSIVR